MLRDILKPIEKELQSVNNLVEKQLIIKAGNIRSYAHLEFSYVNKTIRPALLILSARLFGCDPEEAVPLGCVFQFIYMASKVQESISEKDSDYIRGDSDPRDGSQFPVLVGDYLYGKFFSFLCKDRKISFLNHLSELICQIHEAGILKKETEGQSRSSQAFREVVRKETAELFAACCVVGASLAGASMKEQELMRRFGLNFGMAYGLLEQGFSVKYVSSYFKEALTCLSNIPDRMEKNIIEQIVHRLSASGFTARRMVI